MDARDADAILPFAEAAGSRLRGMDARAAFAELEQHHDELSGALGRFVEDGRFDEAARLAGTLIPFWMASKRLDEGGAWFDRVLAMPGDEDDRRGRALYDAGYLAFWTGDDERSRRLVEQALAIGRRLSDPTIIALALAQLARIALRSDVDAARTLLREALEVTEGTDDRIGRSSAMHVLGVAAQMSGDLLEARALMTERIAIAREQGNMATISSEAGNLSMVERQLGNLDAAEALAREALEIDVQRGDELAIPWKVNGLAAVAADRGEHERAATLIGIADGAMAAAGGGWPPDEWEQYERTVTVATAAMDAGAFERSRAAGVALSADDGVAFALRSQAAG